jgi:hypothetical protein
MLRGKTTFVLGAGASHEARLPLGAGLKDAVAELLNFNPNNRLNNEHQRIWATLAEHCRLQGEESSLLKYIEAGWHIRDAMPMAASIDNFIEAHRHNHYVSTVGKIAISYEILRHERGSPLMALDIINERKSALYSLSDTYYNFFFQRLCEGLQLSDLDRIFKNCSVISFNYDRTLEHYLFHAIQTYYGVDPTIAGSVMETLEIIHPYGSVGSPRWQKKSNHVELGEEIFGAQLLKSANGIKTFSEQLDDQYSINMIEKMMGQADTIIFLGFGFHKQNINLISLKEKGLVRRIYATALGLSEDDCGIIETELAKSLKNENILIKMGRGQSCKDIFLQNRRSF